MCERAHLSGHLACAALAWPAPPDARRKKAWRSGERGGSAGFKDRARYAVPVWGRARKQKRLNSDWRALLYWHTVALHCNEIKTRCENCILGGAKMSAAVQQ